MKLGPWHSIYDTNSNKSNLKCFMYKDHSLYSLTQANRIKTSIAKSRMDIDLIRKILADSKGILFITRNDSFRREKLLIYQYFD